MSATPRVIIRPGAYEDMKAHVQYLAGRSVDAADRFAAACFDEFDRLAAMPGDGPGASSRIRAPPGSARGR